MRIVSRLSTCSGCSAPPGLQDLQGQPVLLLPLDGLAVEADALI